MSLADYAHWNEDAQHMWWQEEGRHIEEPPEFDEYASHWDRWRCCGEMECYCDEDEDDE